MSKTQSKLGVTISGPDCCCWANLIYFYTPSIDLYAIKSLLEDCVDGVINWQFSDDYGTTWSVLNTLTDPGFGLDNTYNPDEVGAAGPGIYRLKITKDGCCDTYSNVIEWSAPV
jgi:hypothetical protein